MHVSFYCGTTLASEFEHLHSLRKLLVRSSIWMRVWFICTAHHLSSKAVGEYGHKIDDHHRKKFMAQDQSDLFREKWSVFEDIDSSTLPLGPRKGDLRAAIAPFIANKTVGLAPSCILHFCSIHVVDSCPSIATAADNGFCMDMYIDFFEAYWRPWQKERAGFCLKWFLLQRKIATNGCCMEMMTQSFSKRTSFHYSAHWITGSRTSSLTVSGGLRVALVSSKSYKSNRQLCFKLNLWSVPLVSYKVSRAHHAETLVHDNCHREYIIHYLVDTTR